MRLVDDWKSVLKRAWSVRLAAAAILFSGLEVMLPFVVDQWPRGVAAGISFFVTIGAVWARIVAQPKMRG